MTSGGEPQDSPNLGKALRFYDEPSLLRALERINRAILAAPSLEAMLAGVLDEMLELFLCDRAWLQFPCDPNVEFFSIPVERTRPEWPGAGVRHARLPMTPFPRALITAALSTEGACRFDGVHLPFAPADAAVEQFGVRSLLNMAIRPRSGPPWCLGIHNCAEARVYTDEEARLFEAIGARLADGLTGLLALQASVADRRRLEQAQHKARIGSYEWNRGDDGAYWSKELYRLLGIAPGEKPAMFRSVIEFIHESDRPRFEALLGRVMQQGGEYEVQARAVRPGGEEWVMHAWGQAVVNANGELESMMGVAQDVTDRAQAEEHQRRLEAQLRQAQKLQAIGQLTGGVAHDFNNLLTVILGNLAELREQLEDNLLGLDLVEQIERAATRAAELTQRLTAFSRKQPLQPRIIDVNGLVVGLESLLRRTLGADVALEVVQGSRLWRTEVDPAQLENALVNLAVNARDAMPEGGRLRLETSNVTIDVPRADAHGEIKPGAYVLISVSDTGTGMSETVLSRAFDPFFTTKGPARGTGLGLSMVYGFVTQSGGHVTLESSMGRGTTVQIYLPRTLQSGVPDAIARMPGSEVAGRGELILVVEDSPHVRALTVRMLERLGYRCEVAEDGPSALAQLAKHRDIALLFTDIVLPNGMNGVEIARAAHASRPELPVLYTSGYTEDAVIQHGRLAPGVQLLEKPFTRAALARHVRDALAGAARQF
ncbi:MAG TPA: ATP-binding protein [Polyangiaceae bacterium]|nr:ATP-binding protein [Polyangiaceae bacterium]